MSTMHSTRKSIPVNMMPFSTPFSGGPEGRASNGQPLFFSKIARPSGPPLNRIVQSRAAFSFAEVMFAVVILGIGFIMVAAVFPVAIQQTQSTGEENTAAAMAREATNAIKSLPLTVSNPLYDPTYKLAVPPDNTTAYKSVSQYLVFPSTVKNYVNGNINTPAIATPPTPAAISAAPAAVVVPFVGARWSLLQGNVIPPSDPRYSYVAFYRRESGAAMAQLIVVSVTNRQRPIYDPSIDTAFPASLSPPQVNTATIDTTATVYPGNPAAGTPTTIYPDTVNVTTGSPQEGFYLTTPFGVPPVAPAGPNPAAPWNRTYRLGRQLKGTTYGPGLFEIDAGDNMMLTASAGGWGSPGVWDTVNLRWNNGGVPDPVLTNGSATLYPTTTLQPTVAYAQLQTVASSPSGQIALRTGPGFVAADNVPPPAAATGAFVIVADDYPFNPDPLKAQTASYQLPPNLTLYSITSPGTLQMYYRVGSMNGRIFRLGQPVVGSPGTYNLDPAYGMLPPPTNGPSYSPDYFPNPDFVAYESSSPPNPVVNAAALRCKVFIVGMGRDNTGSALGGPGNVTYSKGAQDIGIFSTYFQVQ